MTHPTQHHHVILTGATGLIGHNLLGCLLQQHTRCAAIVRNPTLDAERLRRLLAPFGIDVDVAIATERLVLIEGDLHDGIDGAPGLRASSLVHVAGCTRFHTDAHGDPQRTNVRGSAELLVWAERHDVRSVHLVSTAYAGGRSRDRVAEAPLPLPHAFNNDYERSKWNCEHLCLAWQDADPKRVVTILRPSIVVGDWTTGRTTSFNGLYLAFRAVRAAVALAGRTPPMERRSARLVLPGPPTNAQNIVPVNYVAKMIETVVANPKYWGRVFNLVNPAPTSNEEIRKAFEDVLDYHGLHFESETAAATQLSSIERLHNRIIDPIRPYFEHSPRFERSNAHSVENEQRIECPHYGHADLIRVFRFVEQAELENRTVGNNHTARTIAEYFEDFLPRIVINSDVARVVAMSAAVRFVITDIPDGQWLCRFDAGNLVEVRRTANGVAEDFGYRVDSSTFLNIVADRIDPQAAFVDGGIDVFGDIERALKMAMILRQFNAERPYHPTKHMQAGNVEVACPR